MDSEGIDALRAQLAELTTKIQCLETNTAAILEVINPFHSDIRAESPPPNDPNDPNDPSDPNNPDPPAVVWESGPYDGCDCKCRFLVGGPNTIARGVYLGLVLAGDVGNLSDHSLKQLDDGLKVIAQRLVPRDGGAPEPDIFAQSADDMAALLNKVSLRCEALPGSATTHDSAFRNHRRGRHLRLEDARQRAFAWAPVTDRRHLLFFETFFQLLLFRGIDVEVLP